MGLSSITAAILGTLTNTVLVLSLMGVLYTGPVATTMGTTSTGLFAVLATLAFTNGIPEIISAIIITPLLTKAIFKATTLSPD